MSKELISKLAGAAVVASMLAGSSVAFAQTYDASTGASTGATTNTSATTNASDTSGTSTSSSTEPGVPNTGAGGEMATNALILLTTGLAAAGAGYYLVRQRVAL